jgi:hypothetical protein
MMADMSGSVNIAVSLASVWKTIVIAVYFAVAYYWPGRVCHVGELDVGELDVVFAFVQVLHE